MQRPNRLPEPKPVPLHSLLDRALVGAFAALVVARPLVPGDDPGRLKLTASGGPASFTLCLLVVLIGFAVWRAAFGRGRDGRWPQVPLLLAGVGVAAYASSRLGDRYARPGLFVGWEWVGLAVAAYLARRLTASGADSRGLMNVVLATAVSVGGLALYQAAADRLGLASADVVVSTANDPLAGDDEFYPELNGPPGPAKQPRGTFDSPETLFIFLMLVLPAALAYAKARRTSAWGRWSVAVPLVLIAAAAAALLANPFADQAGQWSAAVHLIASHPALGVGPGNFARSAPDALSAHNAWLGLAATTGLVGLGLFAGAVGLAIRQAWPTTTTDRYEPPVAGTRWEFYLGGTAGLLLGFVWAFGAMPAEAPAGEVFRIGATAIGRAALWFAAFALLETIRPDRVAIGRAVMFGAGIVLAYGLVSDAPGRPTVLFPLFVLLTLGANLVSPNSVTTADGQWTKPVRVVGVIAAAGLAVTHLVTAALPAWGTADSVRQARMASRHFHDRHREIDRARPGAERATALTKARGFLLENILQPLREATKRDPDNAALYLELVRWRRWLWEYQLVAEPATAVRVVEDAGQAGETAGTLDPRNPAAPRAMLKSLLEYRRRTVLKHPEWIAAVHKRVERIAELRPEEEVPLRFQVAMMIFERGDPEDARTEAVRVLELHRAGGHGRLTDEQRAELTGRAAKLTNPPPIVLEEWTR